MASDERQVGAGPALGWSFLNTAVARFGTLAIGIVLARLLGPQEFGTFAVAFVALMAILSFNELGVSLAIVRWRRDPAEIAPTVTTISLGMSAALMVGMVAVAPWFANLMGDPDAAPLVQLLSICVLINGAVATPAALMQRRFRQDQRMVADQVNVWVGALVSVGMAAAGCGAISLVVGRIAGAGLSALLFVKYSPEPYRLGFDRKYARQLLAFGLPLAGASIIVFLVSFVDQLVVGHLLGSVMLGYYVLAANLASWPVTMFSQPLRSVAPALFSRMQHDPALLRSSFSQVLRPLASVALPVCAVISVTAPQLIEFVYGDQWAAAGPVLRWLAILAALRIFFELAYDYLVVLARSRSILIIQIVWIVVLVPVLWRGVAGFGIEGAAAALVIVSATVSLPMYLVEFRRAGIAASDIFRAVWLPGLAACAVVAGSQVAVSALNREVAALAVSGIIAGVLSGAVVWRVRDDLSVLQGSTE